MKIFIPEKFASLGKTCLSDNLRDMIVWGKTDNVYDEFISSGADIFGFSNYFYQNSELHEILSEIKNKTFFIFHEFEEPWKLPESLKTLEENIGELDYRVIAFHCPKEFSTFNYRVSDNTLIDYPLKFHNIGVLPFLSHQEVSSIKEFYHEPYQEHDFDIFSSLSLYKRLTLSQRESFFGEGCKNFYRYVLPRIERWKRIDIDVSPKGVESYKYKRDNYFEMVRRSRVTIHLAGGGAHNDAMYFDILVGGLSLRSNADFITIFGPRPDLHCLEFRWERRMDQVPSYEDYDDFVLKINELFNEPEREERIRTEGNKLMKQIVDDLLNEESQIVEYAQKAIEKLIVSEDNSMLNVSSEYQII